MIPTYNYKKQQVYCFYQKRFLIYKLNLKIASNMSSQIGIIDLFCCRYYYKTATISYKIFETDSSFRLK